MTKGAWPDSRLGGILSQLERHYGTPEPPPVDGPFEMILWEIVAYLADDARRKLAFEALRQQVGTTPQQILAAPKETLCEITRLGGGVAAGERAGRLQQAAYMAQEQFGGDLERALQLPMAKAKKALQQFPMIGEPGAEKLLLFAGRLPVLALESNGLRVLLRLGFGKEQKSYSATYRSARDAAAPELLAATPLLPGAHSLLREHGRQTCRRSRPDCFACVLRPECPFAKSIRDVV